MNTNMIQTTSPLYLQESNKRQVFPFEISQETQNNTNNQQFIQLQTEALLTEGDRLNSYQFYMKSNNRPSQTEMCGGLEDGRQIRFYFNRFMIIENGCLFFALMGSFLSIIYYESDFGKPSSYTSLTLLWLIFIGSIFQIGLTVIRYQARLDLRKKQQLEDLDTTIKDFSILKLVLAESFIILLQPYPFMNEYYFKTYNLYDKKSVDFKVNHLFCILILARLYIILRVLLGSTKYASPRAMRVGRMYGCQTGYQYVMRCLFKDHPLKAISGMFLFQVFFFAWALRIAERPLTLKPQSQDQKGPVELELYLNCLWCVIITMTTVGYGDFYPRSIVGRLLISAIAIWGIYTLSMLVVVLQETFKLSHQEERSLNVLICLQKKTELRKRAASILTLTARMKRGSGWGASDHSYSNSSTSSKQYQIDYKHQEKLKVHSNIFQMINRDIRILHEKDNFQDQMFRMFDLVREDIKQLGVNQGRLRQFIENQFNVVLNENIKDYYSIQKSR